MKEHATIHLEELSRLDKIEGQIRGIKRMIEEKRYCVDILTQISAAAGAIKKVELNILTRHLKGCVHQSFSKGNRKNREEKIGEIIALLEKFRKY